MDDLTQGRRLMRIMIVGVVEVVRLQATGSCMRRHLFHEGEDGDVGLMGGQGEGLLVALGAVGKY